MPEIRDSKVLVIGGAGFVGSYVVEELLQENVGEVVIYDNFCRGTMNNLEYALDDRRVRVNKVGGDITQGDILRSAMKGMDYVFHLAALWLLQCYDFPRSAFDVNIGGTFNVLEACVEADVKKLVYSSSASVYGDALETPMTEEHPYNNRTFYGATKIASEHMCRAFNARYDFDYVGLRYMNIYGPRQDYLGAYVAVIMKMLDRIDQGLPPVIYGDGSQAYDFIYVQEVARANVLALKSEASDEFFNVGGGKKTSIAELAQILIELTGADMEPIFEEAGQTFVTNRVGSIEKAKEMLGFEAKVDLREGIQRLIEWRRRDIERNSGGHVVAEVN